MEIFQMPISAVVAIFACCSAIAVTAWNPAFDTEPSITQSISQKAYYSTYAERLLNRHLRDEELAYEQLLKEARAAYGDKAEDELLKTVETAIKGETNHELRGRLFTLKGLLFMENGSKEKALESLKTAITFDPYNKFAVETLNTASGVGGGKAAENFSQAENLREPHATLAIKQP